MSGLLCRMTGIGAFAAMILAGAFAQAATLTPANPQPGNLRPGLAVKYAYPSDVRLLSEANSWKRHNPKAGPPLVGFDYPDTEPGQTALTSIAVEKVVAFIDGYIRFDQAGTYKLEFWSNDGLEVTIGGQRVYRKDGRAPCSTNGWDEVQVPQPGWYKLEATFFQRLNTSCLLMKWAPPGGQLTWTPNSAFGH